MSSRPSVVVTNRVPSYGGESPNAFVASITVQMRAHWPPLARREEVELAAREAYERLLAELEERIP